MSAYPNSIFSIVPKVNKSPVEYNAEKTKTIFAEDINLPVAEIVAIENELGINPKGSYATVAEYLSTLETMFNQFDSNLYTRFTASNPLVFNTGDFSIELATTIQDGYLSSTDWNTFNNKQPAGSYLTAVVANSPLSGSGTSGSHLAISQASSVSNGYLSSTDWNTFNNKVSSYWTQITNDIRYTTGKVAIGTNSFLQNLTVQDNLVAYNATNYGTYFGLFKGAGSLPGYTTRQYPVLKTDYSGFWFSANGYNCGFMSNTGGNTLFSLSGASQTQIQLNCAGDSFIRGGKLGIGTSSPAGELEIYNQYAGRVIIGSFADYTGSNYSAISLCGSNVLSDYNFSSNTTDKTLLINRSAGYSIEFRENNAVQMILTGSFQSFLGIGLTNPTYRISLPNTANTAGRGVANSWTTYSDQTLKTNVKPLKNCLHKILSLVGVSFDWIDSGSASSGFIAQQVEPIIPEIVTTAEDNIKSIDYGRLTPYLVNAIKELKEKVDSLTLKIA